MTAYIDELTKILIDVIKERGTDEPIVNEENPDTRRVTLTFWREADIKLEADFGIHLKKGNAVSFTYTFSLRWKKAEEMMRDLQPPPPAEYGELSPVAMEARRALYPIAQLRVAIDETYFKHASPVSLHSDDQNSARLIFEDTLNTLVETIIPNFIAYSNPDELAITALRPEKESYLLLLPVNVAAILVTAGKENAMEAWKTACNSGVFGKHASKPQVMRRDEEMIAKMLRYVCN